MPPALGQSIKKAGPGDRRRQRGPTPGVGRKEQPPTDDERLRAQIAAASGISKEALARVLNRSVEWVEHHLAWELEAGLEKCNLAVAGRMFSNAMNPNKERSTIFWMESRLGWTTKQQPVDINHTVTIKSYPGDEGL